MSQKKELLEKRAAFYVKNEVYEYTEIVVMSIVVAFLMFTFLFRPATVLGESMLPTLQDGDCLIISRLFYKPAYGDIVVITKPNSENLPYIKRVIATGGQTVDIDFEKGQVTVDFVVLDEPYINELTMLKEDVNFPITVPEGEVFVMGDNRNHSKDSRYTDLGTVDEGFLLGRCIFRFMPIKSAGLVV